MSTPNFAGHSDIGRKRTRNDDRWGADPALGLYMVADGVGSSTHGDLAAALTVEGLPAYVAHYLGGVDLDDEQAAARLGGAVGKLAEDLYARSRTDESIAGADTTLVAAVITDSRVLIAHLGDSRAYLFRDGRVQRLTSDHTIVQAVVDAGEITEEEAAHHPNRSVLTRHVLMKPPSKPDSSAVGLQPGDRILLCSDGLHGLVDDTTLAAILARHPSPADACQVLIEAANQAGGSDNITAVVVNVEAKWPPRPPGSEPLDNTVALSEAPTVPGAVATPNLAATQQHSLSPPPPQPSPPPPPQPSPPPPPQMGTPSPQPRRRRGALMWGVIAGIVAIVAALVAGYLLLRPAGTADPNSTPTSPTAQPVPTTRHTLQPAAPAGPTVLPFDPERWLGYVAVDRSGNVYITDFTKDPSTGAAKDEHVVMLALGSSTPTVLPFTAVGHLCGLAVDTAGNVYVTDSFSGTSDVDNRVVNWRPVLAARASCPSPASPTLKAMTMDGDGNVYVVDRAQQPGGQADGLGHPDCAAVQGSPHSRSGGGGRRGQRLRGRQGQLPGGETRGGVEHAERAAPNRRAQPRGSGGGQRGQSLRDRCGQPPDREAGKVGHTVGGDVQRHEWCVRQRYRGGHRRQPLRCRRRE